MSQVFLEEEVEEKKDLVEVLRQTTNDSAKTALVQGTPMSLQL